MSRVVELSRPNPSGKVAWGPEACRRQAESLFCAILNPFLSRNEEEEFKANCMGHPRDMRGNNARERGLPGHDYPRAGTPSARETHGTRAGMTRGTSRGLRALPNTRGNCELTGTARDRTRLAHGMTGVSHGRSALRLAPPM
jgi:hypothetical protein